MADTALKVRGLKKHFPGFHLGTLDLTVPKGAIYGYIGPNGAGKTTTINLIMNMGRKSAGTVEVFGLDHEKEEAAAKSHIGYASPDLVFDAWGKVHRVVRFLRGFYEDWDDAYCLDLLERMGIGWNDRISTLSFGARIKLGVVMALSHRPGLLLLDEPLAGLDALSKQEVFTELLRAVQDENRTVFISSHNLSDLERYADHIGILHEGRLLLEGPTAALVERFRIVDCMAPDGAAPRNIPGVRVQERAGQRWRLLVDTAGDALPLLAAAGMTELTESPVSLEDLFVALVKGS